VKIVGREVKDKESRGLKKRNPRAEVRAWKVPKSSKTTNQKKQVVTKKEGAGKTELTNKNYGDKDEPAQKETTPLDPLGEQEKVRLGVDAKKLEPQLNFLGKKNLTKSIICAPTVGNQTR